MEHHGGNAMPYEVRCQRCSVSFPVGTKHCLHCGERLGRPGAPPRPSAQPASPVLSGGPEEDDGEVMVPSAARRIGSISLWVLIALGAAISRICAEG